MYQSDSHSNEIFPTWKRISKNRMTHLLNSFPTTCRTRPWFRIAPTTCPWLAPATVAICAVPNIWHHRNFPLPPTNRARFRLSVRPVSMIWMVAWPITERARYFFIFRDKRLCHNFFTSTMYSLKHVYFGCQIFFIVLLIQILYKIIVIILRRLLPHVLWEVYKWWNINSIRERSIKSSIFSG